MRKFVFLTAMLIALQSYAQDTTVPSSNSVEEVVYTNTKDIKLSKEQLYRNARTWVATNLKEFTQSIQMDDPISGRIIVQYVDNKDMGRGSFNKLSFSVMIDCKDNKYRYIIDKIQAHLYIKQTDTNIICKMSDYREYMKSEDVTPSKERALELDSIFIDIGNTIDTNISIVDDF